jgi:hypothetical protein
MDSEFVLIDQAYRKEQWYLRYQMSITIYITRYIFIIYLIDLGDVNTLLYK